jgi:hypothetical protein
MCIIKDNIVEFRDTQADIIQTNNYFCIKDSKDNEIFKLIVEAEKFRLATLKMKYKNNKINVDRDTIDIISSRNAHFNLKCKHMKNMNIAFNLLKDGSFHGGG